MAGAGLLTFAHIAGFAATFYARLMDSQASTRVGPIGELLGPDGSHDCLVVIHPCEEASYGRRQVLCEGYGVGRGHGNDLVLQGDLISRQHCRFERSRGGWRVVDTGSTNGTFVRDAKVHTRELQSGDQVRIGPVILKYLAGADLESEFLETVYRMAIEDPLTELPNRRAFEQALAREIPRARRYQTPLALALFDLDHFRQINTEFGHPGGDLVLGEFARILRGRARAGDDAARLGGEEFALLFPQTDLSGAITACESLRATVADHAFFVGKRPVDLSVSVGVAAFDESMSPETFLAKADAELYRAKKAGRNRVEGRS